MTLNTAPVNGGTAAGADATQPPQGDVNGPTVVWARTEAAAAPATWTITGGGH